MCELVLRLSSRCPLILAQVSSALRSWRRVRKYSTGSKVLGLAFLFIVCIIIGHTNMMNTVTKRDSQLVKWHSKGLTQTDIAEKIGVTRQRVQQLEKRLGLTREHTKGITKFSLTCETCRNEFLSSKNNRKFCCRDCFYASRKITLTPKEEEARLLAKRKRNQEKASHYYHNVFKKRKDWRKIVKERNLKYGPQSANK